MFIIRFSKQADKDKKNLKAAGLEKKTKDLLNILQEDPFKNPPPYEALVGNLSGFYSRRINIQHRLVYTVSREKTEYNGTIYDGTVLIARMWTHYEGM
ncbi:MAG: Txe/YoeB family addiction module toxin [Lachnospiraceae bacterium]|nr:Txe/YoeB family addiction module toxin [Lachnospiraceae bacterium]